MKAQLLTMTTPDGPFTIIARDGVVLASGWTADTQDLTGQIHPELLPDAYEPVEHLGPISAAVDAFYAGDPAPATYTEYAQLSGNAKAVRAAASACAFNAAALFVPCHRVVRTDGTMGGFRWGLRIKESLLAREKQAPAAD